MDVLTSIFDTANPVIGVVHLLPLPTSPRWGYSLEPVIARAEQEATALAAGGVDGIIVENYYDAPFCKDHVDPAVVSAMSVIVQRLKTLVSLPLGLNVLRNDGHSALAVATCVGAPFIRINILTGIMATDQGLIEGQAYQLLRYRRELGSDVKIFADVLVKHAWPLGPAHLSLAVADTVERGLADGIILSGSATGYPPDPEDLRLARSTAPHTPLLVGSGANDENVGGLLQVADGVIVASSLKRPEKLARSGTSGRDRGGSTGPGMNGSGSFEVIDPIRVRNFVDAFHHGLKQRAANAAALTAHSAG